MTRKRAPLPTRQQLLDFIEASPIPVGKRELARAFCIAPEDRPALREIMKGLGAKGAKRAGLSSALRRSALPETMLVEINGMDNEGELIARPLDWSGEGAPPRIFMAPYRAGEVPLGLGDQVLARLRRLRPGVYEGHVLKRMTAGPAQVLGVFEKTADGLGRLRPTDKRQKADFIVIGEHMAGAQHGELVLADILPGRPHGLKPARIVERLGDMDQPRAISLIAIHARDIPTEFPPEALAQAEAAGAAALDEREDLRTIPLVTIDGADARDFDDAVWAEAEGEGWHLIVAIADVAWYVRPGDALDREAFNRGNSVYFPDRVVPMLPEALSNGWCSLKPDEERPCLAVHIHIDAKGEKLRHRFVRGLMRSAARLTYEQVQATIDGKTDAVPDFVRKQVLPPLHAAWKALFEARKRRGVLELDLPERKVEFNDQGRIERIVPRPQLDSHRLIEDCMIAANVAAAEQIESLGLPCMYRVHDAPSADKLEALRDFLSSLDLPLAKGQVLRPAHFNAILAKAKPLPEAHLVNEVVLRSQAQASYGPTNIGHFGLGLARYAHFTSPIRRYADLLVHRALVKGLSLGAGALPADMGPRFTEIGEHISTTERRAAAAERDALDRYTAAYLKDRVGATFQARISGVARFGLFVRLDETGADGLVPASSLPGDFYVHDERRHCLSGRRFGQTFTLGDQVEVILAEANVMTGGLVFNIAGKPVGSHMPKGRGKVLKPGKRNAPRKPRRPTPRPA